MHKILLLFGVVALLALAMAAESDLATTITRFATQVNHDGSYGFDIAQSDGTEFKESGVGGQLARGSYAYFSPEGEHIEVNYEADDHGFRPESNVIPTPPPIPEYILKALQFIREHPTAEELADQQVRAALIR